MSDLQNRKRSVDDKDDVVEEDPSRRDVLKAVGKYSAILAGASTVILSADEVLAQPKPCSQIGGNGNGQGPPRCRD